MLQRKGLLIMMICLVLGVALVFALRHSAAVAARQTPSDPVAFLKWSMGRNQALTSFQATCAWKVVADSTPSPVSATRTVLYVKPNQFKVVSTTTNDFVLTAVSDGKKVVEYTSLPNQGAQTYPSPATIAEATSMLMQHPMFCGSLLYKFFGGAAAFTSLVDTTKGKVQFGPDVTLDGQKCKTVRFYATGLYGSAQIAIGQTDGLVRRITYGSEPLLEMMKGQAQGNIPKSYTTTEEYTKLVVSKPIAVAQFDTTLPKGMTETKAPSPNQQADEGTPPVPIGNAAPDFQVASLDGKPQKLSDLRGKIVMLDFWATWCPPCRASLPETQKLHQEYADKGLAVLAISEEDKNTVEPFLKENHYTFPTYLDAGDKANGIYKVSGIPTTVIIDRQGHLAAYMVGLQQPETIRAALKKAGLATQ